MVRNLTVGIKTENKKFLKNAQKCLFQNTENLREIPHNFPKHFHAVGSVDILLNFD